MPPVHVLIYGTMVEEMVRGGDGRAGMLNENVNETQDKRHCQPSCQRLSTTFVLILTDRFACKMRRHTTTGTVDHVC